MLKAINPKFQRLVNAVLAASLALPSEALASKRCSSMAKARPKRFQEALIYIEDHPNLFEVNRGTAMSYEPNGDTATLPLPLEGITLAQIVPDEASQSQKDYAVCCLALLHLAFRDLDRAHNAITPYSCNSPTHYAGPPVVGSSAAIEAAYIHAMVHRAEGEVEGEFGTGFSNSVYWSRVAGDDLPFLAPLMDFTKAHSSLKNVTRRGSFDHGDFVYAIRRALEKNDPQVLDACSQVVEREWWLVMEHCLEKTKGTGPRGKK